MDVSSFKLGVRAKRLCRVAKSLERKSTKLVFASKGCLTRDDAGVTDAARVRIALANCHPPNSPREEIEAELDASEEILFDVAFAVIRLLEAEKEKK